jgi:hypothetical protein
MAEDYKALKSGIEHYGGNKKSAVLRGTFLSSYKKVETGYNP